MEILRDVSIDWLGKKWIFLSISFVLLAVGVGAYIVHGGLAYGIDFTGGTIIYLKFDKTPDIDAIRSALRPESVGTTIIQQYDTREMNSVVVRMQMVFETEQGVDAGQKAVRQLLSSAFDPQNVGRGELDFNSVGLGTVAQFIRNADPDNLQAQNKTAQEAEDHYQALARSLLDYRDRTKDGLVNSLDELAGVPGSSAAVVDSLRKGFYTGSFAVKGVESVGAVVGANLRRRASLAVGLSLLGMLVYIGFRFKPVYGVAAVIALFHDVLITLGLFAVTGKEISLIVVAAILTLVGYSVNDTIVIFDRVRENLPRYRRQPISEVLNLSINQTLSRTVMTSGMTFLSVLALFVFGGEVLNAFSFALVIGIIAGTYSTIALASPIVVAWTRMQEDRPKRKTS